MILILVGIIFALLSVFMLGSYTGCHKQKYFLYGLIYFFIGLAIRAVTWYGIEFTTEIILLDIFIAIALSAGAFFLGFFWARKKCKKEKVKLKITNKR